MYQNGLGVQRDYHKAMEYLLKAANQGSAHAQFNIGIHSLILSISNMFLGQVSCIEMVQELNKITTKQ